MALKETITLYLPLAPINRVFDVSLSTNLVSCSRSLNLVLMIPLLGLETLRVALVLSYKQRGTNDDQVPGHGSIPFVHLRPGKGAPSWPRTIISRMII